MPIESGSYYKDSNFNFDSYGKLGQDERAEVKADSELKVKTDQKINAHSTRDIQGFADDNSFSQYHKDQVGLLKEKGFHAWKVVRGDGNCYYRSVMIQYLEKIFTYDDQKDRIDLLIKDYEKFVADQNKPGDLGKKSFMSAADFKKAMEELNESQKEEKLQKIHDKIAYKNDFDISLVGWLRYKIAKKIEDEPNLEINGLSIEFALTISVGQYIRDVVAKMDEDAQDAMFAITPLILNARIDTVSVDVKTKVNDVTFQEYRPLEGFNEDSKGGGEVKTEGKVDGSLGKNTLHLFPFLKGGHYDIIYQDQDLIHWQREGVKLPSHMGSGLFDENDKELTPNDKYSKSTNIEYSDSASVAQREISALGQLLQDQDKCVRFLIRITNFDPEKINELSSKIEVDKKVLVERYGQNTLNKLDEVGNKLKERLQEKGQKVSSLCDNIVLALAIITVIPAVIMGLRQVVSSYREKIEFDEQRKMVAEVAKELVGNNITNLGKEGSKLVKCIMDLSNNPVLSK